MKNDVGKVYFVGAGPSDPGLLTVKGLQVLQRAQVVIYDALIGPGICGLIPQTAEKIPVGKRSGRHSAEQEQINRLILEQAQKGRCVVRLKGGDPFVFGRGGEELELLLERHIPYEIVPGVTSAVAVPAYAGIPVTYRGLSSSLHILTGHRKQMEPPDMDFDALVRVGGTYVCLMGMSALHEIVTGFLQAGMPTDMPAAVIEQGTGAGQRAVITELALLEKEVSEQKLKAPAVIVIGKTVACGKRYAWREKLPLSKCRVIVTRPASGSKKLTLLLQQLGAEVVELPSIRTQLRDCAEQLRLVLDEIAAYQYLVFTSSAGVDYFFELLDNLELDVRRIGMIKLAVIGNATADALKRRGLRPQLMPEQYNSEALGKLLHEAVPDGGKVLLLRSALGNKSLANIIRGSSGRQKQITVTDLAIYDTILHTADDADAIRRSCAGFHMSGSDLSESNLSESNLFESNLFESDLFGSDLLGSDTFGSGQNGITDMVMFTSASTVRGFVQMTQDMDHTKVCAVCIGQMTADQASAYGMCVHQAQAETVESMVETAVRLHRQRM